MKIPQTFRHCRQIPVGDLTRAEENPCVIIRRFSAKKPVRHNQDTNTPPGNCEVRHFGCICVLPDSPSERPDPRVLWSIILTLIETTTGLQNAVPNKETSKLYTRKSSTSYLQADKHTSENSHSPTGRRRNFIWHAVLQVINNSLWGGQMHTHPSERGYTVLQKTSRTFPQQWDTPSG